MTDTTDAGMEGREQEQGGSGGWDQAGECVPLVVAGPSGVGKSTLVKRVLKDYPEAFGFCVSHTTRAPRETELEGREYYFTDEPTFTTMISTGAFLEHARYNHTHYGTSLTAVRTLMNSRVIPILDIDLQGVRQVKAQKHLPVNAIFISPPSMEELESRLKERGTETEDSLKRRLKAAEGEVEAVKGEERDLFEQVLVNEDVEVVYAELVGLLKGWYQLPEPSTSQTSSSPPITTAEPANDDGENGNSGAVAAAAAGNDTAAEVAGGEDKRDREGGHGDDDEAGTGGRGEEGQTEVGEGTAGTEAEKGAAGTDENIPKQVPEEATEPSPPVEQPPANEVPTVTTTTATTTTSTTKKKHKKKPCAIM